MPHKTRPLYAHQFTTLSNATRAHLAELGSPPRGGVSASTSIFASGHGLAAWIGLMPRQNKRILSHGRSLAGPLQIAVAHADGYSDARKRHSSGEMSA